MTTRDLLKAARTLNFDREDLMNHSIAFANVSQGGFNEAAESTLEMALGVQSAEYKLEDLNELPVLAQKLAAKSDDKFKIYIVNVKESIPTVNLNEISKEIQETVKASGISNYIMGIVGVKSGTPIVESNVSLLQSDSVTLAAVSAPYKAASKINPVKDYLFPDTLSGIFISLFIFVMLLIGFLLLMKVQTPIYLPLESIDFGKIEK